MAKMPSDPSSRRVIAQMPLGGHVGVMARVAEQCRQGRNPVVQLAFVTGLALLVGRHERGHIPDPGKVVVDTARQHRARRRTGGAHAELGEAPARRAFLIFGLT